jgi:hypothetical protein
MAVVWTCCCALAEAGPRLPVASSSESLVGKSKLRRTGLSGFSAGEQAALLREGMFPGRGAAAVPGTVLRAGGARCCPDLDLLKVRAAGCWRAC